MPLQKDQSNRKEKAETSLPALNIPPVSKKHQETFGILQPALKPFFPGWNLNLHLPEQDFKPGLYTFKVSLGKGC